MSGHLHLQQVAALAARLRDEGIEVVEHHYELGNESFWSVTVAKEKSQLEVDWHGGRDQSLAIAQLRYAVEEKESWDKPEWIPIPDEERVGDRLMHRAYREIVARLKNA